MSCTRCYTSPRNSESRRKCGPSITACRRISPTRTATIWRRTSSTGPKSSRETAANLMGSYLDWARAKLSGAPLTSCAFWIDHDRLLSRANGGGLEESETQSLVDDEG